jgi:cytochrome c55X
MINCRPCLFSVMLLAYSAPGFAIDVPRSAELENMLIQDCGSCHGLTFNGGLGPPLLPEALKHKPRDFLIQTILQGRANTAMPPWQGLLNQQEAAWMVDRLKAGMNQK